MPNWVYNNLTVIGNADDLDKFVEQVGQSYETRHYNWETKKNERKMTENVGFSFWNIVAPDESILDEYWGRADHTAGKNNWYGWNIKNWGTKWDACEVDIERHSDDHLQVRFHTAWSPPYPVLEAASVQFPTLTFSLEWEEEQGFGAEVVFTAEDGVNEIRTWDIPNSHADYANRDNEDGCFCNLEDPEYWFDDCPGKKEALEDDAGILEDLVELAG